MFFDSWEWIFQTETCMSTIQWLWVTVLPSLPWISCVTPNGCTFSIGVSAIVMSPINSNIFPPPWSSCVFVWRLVIPFLTKSSTFSQKLFTSVIESFSFWGWWDEFVCSQEWFSHHFSEGESTTSLFQSTIVDISILYFWNDASLPLFSDLDWWEILFWFTETLFP